MTAARKKHLIQSAILTIILTCGLVLLFSSTSCSERRTRTYYITAPDTTIVAPPDTCHKEHKHKKDRR